MELKREEFEAWLRTLPPDEPMAERVKCETCPIAKWLVFRGYWPVEVYADECLARGPLGERISVDTPEWAEEFIAIVDEASLGEPITAAECLAILEDIPR